MLLSCSSDLGAKNSGDCLSDSKKNYGNLNGSSNKSDQHGLTKFVAVLRTA